MSNVAVIFAGGVGTRMHTKDKPKQFLMVHGKPIIVHTIEVFQNHQDIDGIVVSCVNGWIDYMNDMVFRYRLDKVSDVVPGGGSGQLSIYNGIVAAEARYGVEGTTVLIHDGVRPLIDADTITKNIRAVERFGSAITCVPAKETLVSIDSRNRIDNVMDRSSSCIARAPQSFPLSNILDAHKKALAEGITNSIDSCTLMSRYGYDLHVVEGGVDNIKVTTPEDFYTFRAIYDARENYQLL